MPQNQQKCRERTGDRAAATPPPRRWIVPCLLAVVFLLAAALGWHRIASPDIRFQLSLGRWIAENGSVPRQDPLTYTLTHRPYVDPQWLYQLALWFTHRIAGTVGLVVANTALSLLAFGLLLVRTRRRDGPWEIVDAALLLLLALGLTWEIRPHVVSWLYLGAVLLVLEAYRRRPGPFIWTLPALMLLWANTHSLFALGWVAMGAYAVFELPRGSRADRRLLQRSCRSRSAPTLTTTYCSRPG